MRLLAQPQSDNGGGSVLKLRRRLFYGWWIVGGSILLQILTAGLFTQAFGTYVAVWQAEFGWSKTVFATAFAVQRGQTAIVSLVQGWLLEKCGPRTVIRAGLMIMSGGFIALSQVHTIVGFYSTFLMLAIGAGLAGFLSLTTTIVNWFEKRRSSALALMQIGISIGGLVIPLIAWGLTAHGWRMTAIASAGLLVVGGFPITWLIRSRPEDYGLRPDGALAGPLKGDRDDWPNDMTNPAVEHGMSTTVHGIPDYSVSEAIRTRAFWLLALGHSTAVMSVAAVTVHIVMHLNTGIGFSLQFAATIVAIMTGAAMLGQIGGGILGDRFDKRVVAATAMLGHAVALLMVAYGQSIAWIFGFAVLHGLAWGIRGPLMQALRADYFGRKSFSKIMGISFALTMVGQMVGPLMVGVLADATGDYHLGFTVLAAIVATASLCFFVLSPPPARMNRPGFFKGSIL